MYAIIETGRTQNKVPEGDAILCDLLEGDVRKNVTFDCIVLASKSGENVTVGALLLKGDSLPGKVLRQDKDRKILVFKYKPKKRVRKLTGHRQRFAEVQITKIELP